MRAREWPLLIFTLLFQMAVGTLMVLALLTILDQPFFPQDVMDDLSSTIFLLVPLLLVLGVLSAILHLRRPGNAKLAMANLKKSWLSREMLLGFFFGIVILMLSLVQLLEIDASDFYTVLLWFGVLTGIGLVYGMSRIYMLRTVPVWNTWATPISFFISAVLLGVLIVSITLSLLFPPYLNSESEFINVEYILRNLGWVSAILLSTQLFVTFIRDRYFLWRGGGSKESVQLVRRRHPILGNLREAYGLLGIGLCILFALQPFSNTDFVFDVAIVGAFLLALTSETIGRFLFYASFKRSGL